MTSGGHIVALGGGGFSDDEDGGWLDRYVLHVAGVPRPRVGFLATASGDAEGYVEKFRTAFEPMPCEAVHVRLFRRTPDLEASIAELDVVYVGGGNTRSMLAVWREWGLPVLLRRAWERGAVLAGISAGAICWFEAGVTDSEAGVLGPIEGLGFLAGSCCPHYDGEAERRPAYREMVSAGALPGGIALGDGAAAHYVGATLQRVVAGRPGAVAFRVDGEGADLREEALRIEHPPPGLDAID